MNEFENVKSQTVILTIPTGSTLMRFNFPTQNFLRYKGIKIVSIEALTTNDMSAGPTGNIVITDALAKGCYFTLYGDDPANPGAMGEWLQGIPFMTLHRLSNGTDPFVYDLFKLQPRNIVWEKSFITLAVSPTPASPMDIILNVGYTGYAQELTS
jgi:hypothetical protein